MTLTKEQLTGIIESAEDVLQALAGTHEDIHPESKKMIEAWDHLNDRAAPPEVVKRLAENALASLTAEPIYQCEFCHHGGNGELQWHWEDVNKAFYDQYDSERRGKRRILYAAPPAPVVQDIGEIRVGRLPTMNQDDYPGLGDWWVQLRIGKDSDEVLARVYGATPQEANSRAEALACRAAMLQGAEPVQEWIPCSERMPEVEGHYLVWANASKLEGYCNHQDIAAYQAGQWSNEFGWLVTHWMPLPTAPQQEVK